MSSGPNKCGELAVLFSRLLQNILFITKLNGYITSEMFWGFCENTANQTLHSGVYNMQFWEQCT